MIPVDLQALRVGLLIANENWLSLGYIFKMDLMG